MDVVRTLSTSAVHSALNDRPRAGARTVTARVHAGVTVFASVPMGTVTGAHAMFAE